MYCRSSAQRLGWQGPTMCNRYPLEIKHGNGESPAFYVGFIWFYMVLYGFILYGFIWFYIIWVLYGFIWFYMVLYGFIWFYMVLCGFMWFYVVLCGFMWFYMVLYHSKFNTDRENKPLFNGNSSSNPYLPVSMLIYWRVYHSKNIYKWVIFHCHVWLPEG